MIWLFALMLGAQPVEPFFFQRAFIRLRAVVGAFIFGDIGHAAKGAINHPAGAVIVRRVAVALLVHMAHLNEAVIGIAIKLAGWFAVTDYFRHPRVIGFCRGKQFFHQRLDSKRQLRIFAVAPNRADLGDIAIETILRSTFLYGHW